MGCQAEEEDLDQDRGDTDERIEHMGAASSYDGGLELVQGKREHRVHSEEHQRRKSKNKMGRTLPHG